MNRFFAVIVVIMLNISGCKQEMDKQEIATPQSLSHDHNLFQLPQEITSIKDSSQMILITAGPFIYGIDKSKRDSLLKVLSNARLPIFDLEFPQQIKHLPSYYIDKFEVINKQYAKFLEETGHPKPRYWSNRLYNQPMQPVVGVSWADAVAYAKWAGKRLPKEKEWEKAARGIDGRIWPWGNIPDGTKYNGKMEGNLTPVNVGSYPEGTSPYEVMDMAGNVYEMTTGFWGNSGRAMRGGCYLNTGAYTRTMFRWATAEEERGAEYLGFRCVADTTIILRNEYMQ